MIGCHRDSGVSVANLAAPTAPAVTVHELAVMHFATWHFRDHIALPHWHHPRYGSFTATFDPFPGYPHDTAIVAETVAHVSRCCPPIWDVEVWVADREEIGRSNGHSNVHDGGHYEGDEYVKDTPTVWWCCPGNASHRTRR